MRTPKTLRGALCWEGRGKWPSQVPRGAGGGRRGERGQGAVARGGGPLPTPLSPEASRHTHTPNAAPQMGEATGYVRGPGQAGLPLLGCTRRHRAARSPGHPPAPQSSRSPFPLPSRSRALFPTVAAGATEARGRPFPRNVPTPVEAPQPSPPLVAAGRRQRYRTLARPHWLTGEKSRCHQYRHLQGPWNPAAPLHGRRGAGCRAARRRSEDTRPHRRTENAERLTAEGKLTD